MPRNNLREHILITASELFYSQGIKATGIDAIVKASGIAKMTLYKYFPSKDDLVLEHLQRNREAMRKLILQGIENEALSSEEKLLAVFKVFEKWQAEPGFRGCPFINATAEFVGDASRVQEVASEFYEEFRKLLAGLAKGAGLANTEELSKQLSMLIAGAMVREQMQKNTDAMRIASEAAKILIEHSHSFRK